MFARVVQPLLIVTFLAQSLLSFCFAQNECARATTPASSLNCAFGVKPTTIEPLTSGISYVAETDATNTSYETFLYPETSNDMPEEHRRKGKALAATIRPLDKNGNVDQANGKILAIAEGMSNTRDEMNAFSKLLSSRRSQVNPKFQFVSYAEGSCDLVCWLDKGVGSVDRQVQVAFIKHSNNRPQAADGTPTQKNASFSTRESKFFPSHALVTRRQLETRILDMKKKYPNLKLVYITSRSFGGWSCSPAGDDYREPIAFEEGFSVKWLIEDQVLGKDPDLAFEGDNAPAPWLAWGPYLWNPEWTQDMYKGDGAHPCERGADAIAEMWFDLLSKDSTSRSWFRGDVLAGVEAAESEDPIPTMHLFQNYPNPFNAQTEIRYFLPLSTTATLRVYNVHGQVVRTLFSGETPAGVFKLKWDARDESGREASSGVYVYRLEAGQFTQAKRLILLR